MASVKCGPGELSFSRPFTFPVRLGFSIFLSLMAANLRRFLATEPHICTRDAGNRSMRKQIQGERRKMRSWKETQLEFEMEVAKVILTRPELSYEKIGKLFSISEDKVLSIIRRRGVQPGRKAGRKPGGVNVANADCNSTKA